MIDLIDYTGSTNSDNINIAVRTTAGIAVYTNEAGDVVIRQDGWPEDDVYIVVTAGDAERLADAIMLEAR